MLTISSKYLISYLNHKEDKWIKLSKNWLLVIQTQNNYY